MKLIVKPFHNKLSKTLLASTTRRFHFFPHLSFFCCTALIDKHINKSRSLYQSAPIEVGSCAVLGGSLLCMFGVWSHCHMVHDSSSSSIDEKASSGVLCKWLACSTRDHICSNINRSRVGFGNSVMFHVKTRHKEQTTSRDVTKARNLFSQSAFCSQPHLVVILQTSSRKRFYGQNA